ncbi:MAG: VOC family protein [Luteimonas sp.]
MGQKITPFLWVDKGNARKAARFYTSVFKDSKILDKDKYEGTPSGNLEIISFELFGLTFTIMDAGPEFKFNESVSFLIDCENQEEVDYYWEKLIEGGEESQCGWLKDKFGLSWQVVPKRLNELLSDPNREKAGRAMQCMLTQKKIVISELEKAYEG